MTGKVSSFSAQLQAANTFIFTAFHTGPHHILPVSLWGEQRPCSPGTGAKPLGSGEARPPVACSLAQTKDYLSTLFLKQIKTCLRKSESKSLWVAQAPSRPLGRGSSPGFAAALLLMILSQQPSPAFLAPPERGTSREKPAPDASSKSVRQGSGGLGPCLRSFRKGQHSWERGYVLIDEAISF